MVMEDVDGVHTNHSLFQPKSSKTSVHIHAVKAIRTIHIINSKILLLDLVVSIILLSKMAKYFLLAEQTVIQEEFIFESILRSIQRINNS